MPKMNSAIYAAHLNTVLQLASRAGGVSRPQLINELNVTRAVAGGLIESAELCEDEALKKGRTQFFVPNGKAKAVAKQSAPKAVAVPESTDALAAADDTTAELDAQLLDTRNTLRAAAAKAGEALGEWMTHQAMVDAMRERLQQLAVRRLAASQ